MQVWSVATGTQKEEFDGGSFAFSKDDSLDQEVGKYIITFKDDMLLITEGQSAMAFFSPHTASHVYISAVRTARCSN
jgi:hypothetical protein